MTKSLQDILDLSHTVIHDDPAWSKVGFGPTEYARAVRTAYNQPVDQTDYAGAANRDLVDYTKQKLDNFFSVLQNYVVHDNLPHQSVFDAATTDKDGHRPADQLVGEQTENVITEEDLLVTAFEVIEEAVVYEVGKLYEANVAFKGFQRDVRVFFPTFKLATRRQLEEAVGKIFPGAIVLSYSVIDKNQRIQNTPLILAEENTELEVFASENVLYESQSGTYIVFEEGPDPHDEDDDYEDDDYEDEYESGRTVLVKEAFNRYLDRLKESI
jgi:hypothetical protein